MSPGCASEGKLPLVFANKEAVDGDLKSTQSVFVRHPDAGATRRKELAAFFARQDPTHHIQVRPAGSVYMRAVCASVLSSNVCAMMTCAWPSDKPNVI